MKLKTTYRACKKIKKNGESTGKVYLMKNDGSLIRKTFISLNEMVEYVKGRGESVTI